MKTRQEVAQIEFFGDVYAFTLAERRKKTDLKSTSMVACTRRWNSGDQMLGLAVFLSLLPKRTAFSRNIYDHIYLIISSIT